MKIKRFFENVDMDGGEEYLPDYDEKISADDKEDKEYTDGEEDGKKEEKNKILRSEEGNVRLRMTTKLKKVFLTLEKRPQTRDIANVFLKNIRKLECNISFFNIIDDVNDSLSFLPRNRIIGLERKEDTETGKKRIGAYKSPQRQQMKLGRIINRLFPGKFKPADIEIFVNEYKGEHDMATGNIAIELVHGKDIAHWYASKMYAGGGGTLNNSCMRNVNKNRFNLYVDNPDQIEMAIYTRAGKLEARALVWHTDKGIYMDRIYYTKDHLANAFKRYAERNGWMYRDQRNLPRLRVRLTTNKREYQGNHPYFDSFRYNNNGTLTAY